MTPLAIRQHRIRALCLHPESRRSPREVVHALGAVQSQDLAASLWAITARTQREHLGAVQAAAASGSIVRTWLLRGTIHWVDSALVRPILDVIAPRLLAQAAQRLRNLELDESMIERAAVAAEEALSGRQQRTREEMYQYFQDAGVPTSAQRGYHILWRLALQGRICFGPAGGRRPVFVWLDEWIPRQREARPPMEAMEELARRYFSSHGPASLHDFAWWSGLTVKDAKAAVAQLPCLVRDKFAGADYWSLDPVPDDPGDAPSAFLLPAFDEYLLGYKNRSMIAETSSLPRLVPRANGIFRPLVVVDGRIVGTWKSQQAGATTEVSLELFEKVSPQSKEMLKTAAVDYADSLGGYLKGFTVSL